MTTDTPIIKPGVWKTAKKVVENYPGISITVVKHEGQEERTLVDLYGIKLPFSETMIETIEKILCTIDNLPDTLSFGNNMGEYKTTEVIRCGARSAELRGITDQYIQALINNNPDLTTLLTIQFVPGQF